MNIGSPVHESISLPLVAAALGGMGLGLLGFFLGRWRSKSLNQPLVDRLEASERERDSAERANQELSQALGWLESAAGTDRLTGAWNRRRFEEASVTLIALAMRNRDPLSLIMFDLDYFKRVNDTHGHGVGDMVLKGVAEKVRAHLRASDALVRWGGEEFLVMAPGTGILGAQALAEKIRESVAEVVFSPAGQMTLSFGVTEFMPGESLEAWVHRADEALYQAKDQGRNRVVIRYDATIVPTASTPSFLELRWHSEYECGQALIDDQHRRLFDLANGLLSFITSAEIGPDFQLQLQMLMAHVAQHFHDEEALLGQLRYEGLATHAMAHKNLLKMARELLADMEALRRDRTPLLDFLALKLIKEHLLTEDRGFFPLFQRNS